MEGSNIMSTSQLFYLFLRYNLHMNNRANISIIFFLSSYAGNKSNKRLSVERIYQKKTQLEHILLRPDSYIGSVEKLTQVF